MTVGTVGRMSASWSAHDLARTALRRLCDEMTPAGTIRTKQGW